MGALFCGWALSKFMMVLGVLFKGVFSQGWALVSRSRVPLPFNLHVASFIAEALPQPHLFEQLYLLLLEILKHP